MTKIGADFRGDGSYIGRQSLEKEALLSQMDRLNKELKEKHGSRGICTIVPFPSKKEPVSFALRVPFYEEGRTKPERFGLVKRGHNASFTLGGLNVAYGLANEVSVKLKDGTFSRGWLDSFLDKNYSEENQKTIGQWVDEFMEWWWQRPVKKNGKQVKKDKNDRRYISAAQFLTETFSLLPQDRHFHKEAIEATLKQIADNQTGKKKVEALNRLLEFAGIYEYKALLTRKREQAIAGIVSMPKYVPTDEEIVETYSEGYRLSRRDGGNKSPMQLESTLRQRWLFGILATYGIRIHEAWMVMNWTNSVEISAGEFIEIDSDTGDEEYAIDTTRSHHDRTIPAFFSPGNDQPLLVIKGGKTGKRIAMPLSPKGEDWVSSFGLREPGRAYLPNVEEPMKLFKAGDSSQYKCSQVVCGYFWRSIRWDLLPFPRFTAHKLRHAYTHRGRLMGINHQTLALSQGHLPSTADMVYARHFAEERTLEAIQLAQEQLTNSQNTTLPPLESAIAHASAIASANPNDSLEALAKFASFMYGTQVTLP